MCKELGIRLRTTPRVYVYSYKAGDTGSLLEYTGDVTVKELKSFAQDHLPKFSKRVTLAQFEANSGKLESLPKVMLLSTKKDTPVIWRALSGLYRKRFIFYDTQVIYQLGLSIHFNCKHELFQDDYNLLRGRNSQF